MRRSGSDEDEAVVAHWLTPAFAAREPATAARLRAMIAARLRAMIAATPAEGYAACCEAIARLDLRPALGRIAAPTLVLAGAEDPATPPEHAERIAAGIPDARLQLLSPAAHLANLEQPQAVARLLAAHFAAEAPA